jgi:hypothetical protein
MRLADFEALTGRLADELPQDFLDGILEVTVSPATLPHPTRGDVYTLGECIPILGDEPGPDAVQSRIVLYHGSFQALAAGRDDFDWRAEAWETLTHELRHHLEWRARVADLEALDAATEQNFARHQGEPYDPLFFTGGERVEEGVYRIEEDFFIDRPVPGVPPRVDFVWHGRSYEVDVPAAARLPVFLTVEGVSEPPPGELVLILRGRPTWLDLVRHPTPFQATIVATASTER